MNDILLQRLRTIPDFPRKGIQFKDITSWLNDSQCVRELKTRLREQFLDKGVQKIACIESRGFVMGSILGSSLGVPIVLIRKPGKLPGNTVQESYEKEYGVDTLEIQTDAIEEGDVVVIHDDLLATGGSAYAAWKLVKQFKPSKVYFSFLIELKCEGLEGRKFLEENTDGEVLTVTVVD